MSEFVAENLSWVNYSEMLRQKSKHDNIPLGASLELTPRCCFDCKMCYVHLTDEQAKKLGRERTAQEWIKIGREIFDAGVLSVLLTGGEVFLRPDFREIYEAYSEMGFLVTIFSNGYLIDEKALEWLSKRPPMNLRITIYGVSNETYEAVTGIKNAFDKVLHNIENILAANINLSLAATIIGENHAELQAMKKFADDRDLKFIHTNNIVKPVRGATMRQSFTEVSGPERTDNPENWRTDKLVEWTPDPFAFCKVKGCGFWVTWDGRLLACSYMERPSVDPIEKGLSTSWRDLQNKLKKIRKPPECSECKYKFFCISCPGILSAEAGFPDRVSETVCQKARQYYEAYSKDFLCGSI